MIWTYLALMVMSLAQAAPPAAVDAPPAAPQDDVVTGPTAPQIPPAPSMSSWHVTGSDFEPDVYPSHRAAARAVGEQWSKVVVAEGTPPARVVIVGAPAHVADELRRAIGRHLPDVGIEPGDVADAAPESGRGEARLTFEVVAPTRTDVEQDALVVEAEGRVVLEHSKHVTPSPGRLVRHVRKTRGGGGGGGEWRQTGDAGTMTLSARGATAATASVRFVDKPWVDEFAEFASRHPDRRWVLARSRNTATDPAQADREARADAADKLAPIVLGQLAQGPGRHHRGVRFEELRSWLEGRMHDDRYVVDRFVQKFDRDFYQVWGQAVLVDASAAHVSTLANDYARGIEARRSDGRKTFAGGAVLILLSFVLYRLVNAYTKGYFTWSLRTAAVVVVVAGVVMLLRMA